MRLEVWNETEQTVLDGVRTGEPLKDLCYLRDYD